MLSLIFFILLHKSIIINLCTNHKSYFFCNLVYFFIFKLKNMPDSKKWVAVYARKSLWLYSICTVKTFIFECVFTVNRKSCFSPKRSKQKIPNFRWGFNSWSPPTYFRTPFWRICTNWVCFTKRFFMTYCKFTYTLNYSTLIEHK